MKVRAFAVSIFSFAVLNCAYAEADRSRVLIETRGYTQAYVKQSLGNSNPRLLASVFPNNVAYVLAADAPGFQPEGENLLRHVKDGTSTRQGEFIREEKGKILTMQFDEMCAKLIGLGLRSLGQGTKQRLSAWTKKPIVIAQIMSGELASAPLDLDRTAGRKIKVIPEENGNMRCNIYKSLRNHKVTYDISVALVARSAYWGGR